MGEREPLSLEACWRRATAEVSDEITENRITENRITENRITENRITEDDVESVLNRVCEDRVCKRARV
jgi:hypothetical protein